MKRSMLLLLRAFVLLVAVDIGLRVRGFRRVAAWVPSVSRSTLATDVVAFDRAQRYARWIDRAARCYVLPARCLPRALALQIWLRREGLPAELRIGVHHQGADFAAHAWVELDGKPVNERAEIRKVFTPLRDPIGNLPDWTTTKWTGVGSGTAVP